jgi:ribosomal protein L11
VVARPGMGAVAPAAPVQPGVGSARVMGPSPMPMGYAPPQQAQVGQPMQQLGGAIAQAAAPQLAPHLQPHGINSGEMGQPWNLRFNQARR